MKDFNVKKSDQVVYDDGRIYIIHENVNFVVQYLYGGYHLRLVGSDIDPFEAMNHADGWEIAETRERFSTAQEAHKWIDTHKKNSDE